MLRAGQAIHLLMENRENGELLGGIALSDFDWVQRSAILGYWVARRHRGNGYAGEATSVLSRTAFRVLKLHRIEAEVFAFNSASAHVLRNLGFAAEGRKRQAARKGTRWFDRDLYGLLATEFRPFLAPPAKGRRSSRR